MKAAITRQGSIVVEDLPDPAPGPGELLVRPLACGICGSDLHALAFPAEFMELARRTGGEVPDPSDGIVFGHEFCAEVVDRGEGATLADGTTICALPIAFGPDGPELIGYSPSRTGGFAELMVVNEALATVVPAGVDPRHAALTEPFAVAARAVNRSRITQGDVALVVGCGPLGLGVIAALKALGHGPVLAADFSPRRRELAERLGADEVLDPAARSPYSLWGSLGVTVGRGERMIAEALGMPTKNAVIFECVGVRGVLQQIIDGAPAGSRIAVVGVCMGSDTIEPGVAVGKELDVIGCFGYNRQEFAGTLAGIAEGKINAGVIITGSVGLGDVAGAFAELARPDDHAKIIVTPGR